ncbi:EID1-like F-box protein 2, partial [Ananas comosus]
MADKHNTYDCESLYIPRPELARLGAAAATPDAEILKPSTGSFPRFPCAPRDWLGDSAHMINLIIKDKLYVVVLEEPNPTFSGYLETITLHVLKSVQELGYEDLLPVMVETMLVAKQYRCTHSSTCICLKGHLTEDALYLIFQHLNWNPRLIAVMSCVCKWFDEIAKRVLWKEFCSARAPKMMHDLQKSGSHNVDGNWKSLGKLLIYCSGCTKGGLFYNINVPGHFVPKTRFSRTSGKCFLLPQCRSDVLYVSDPCEHHDQGDEGDVGFFRGIFQSFSVSRVKRMLIDRQAKFHPTETQRKRQIWSDAHRIQSQ